MAEAVAEVAVHEGAEQQPCSVPSADVTLASGADNVASNLLPLLDALAAAAAGDELKRRLQPVLQALSASEAAGETATQRVLELLVQARQQWSEQKVVHACKLARAMCLAGRGQLLAQAGAGSALLSALLSSQASPLTAAACCEALVSLAVRQRSIAAEADTAAAAPGLVRLLASYGASSGPPAPRPAPPSQPATATDAQATAAAGGPAAATEAASEAPGGEPGAAASQLPQPPLASPSASSSTAVLSLLRLLTTLVHNKRMVFALFKSGLASALAALLVPSAASIAAPASDSVHASTGTGDGACSASEGTAAKGTGAAARRQEAAAAAAVAAQQVQVQRHVLQFVLGLSSRSGMQPLLLTGGLPVALRRLLQQGTSPNQVAGAAGGGVSRTPASVLETAVAVINNLACGGRGCQEALVQAGLVPVLVALLQVRNAAVLFNALDALSSITISCRSGQDAVAACGASLGPSKATGGATPATPATGVTAEAASAGAGQGGASETVEGPSAAARKNRTDNSGGNSSSNDITSNNGNNSVVALLASMLGSRHVVLTSKACRCLSNLALDHPANQAALLACPGALPALVSLAGSGQPGLVRLALGTLTNVVGRNEAAQQAAFEAGALPVAVGLLRAAVAALRDSGRGSGRGNGGVTSGAGVGVASGGPPAAPQGGDAGAPGQAETTLDVAPEAAQGTEQAGAAPGAAQGKASDSGAAVEAGERVCLLLANLVYHSREAKLRVVEAGAVPLLVALLSSNSPGVVAGAAAAMSNLAVRDTELQNKLAGAGAIQRLAALLPGASSSSTSSSSPSASPGSAAVGPASPPAAAAAAARTTAAGASTASGSPAATGTEASGRSGSPSSGTGGAPTAAAARALRSSAHASSSSSPAGFVVPPVGALAPGTAPAEVAAKACHALGSLTFNNPANQELLVSTPGSVPTLLAALRSPLAAPAVTAEAARALGNVGFGNANVKDRLGRQGAVALLVSVLKVQHVATVKAALVALVNLCDASPANQAYAFEAGIGPTLVKLLRVRGEEVLSRACFCVHSLVPLPSNPSTSSTQAGHAAVLGAASAAKPGPLSDAAAIAVAVNIRFAQDELARAGVIPALLLLLGHPKPDVVEKALLALGSLVQGSKENQIRVAAAGGIAPLAALIDTPTAQLCRPVVDTWVALGGTGALVKLLSHKHPAIVEQAARKIVVWAMDGGSGVGAFGTGAPNTAPKLGPSPAVSELLKFGAAAALVRAAQAQQRSARVVQAVLAALAALARSADGRGRLVDAGALAALQALMGHRTPAVSRLATSVSQALFVK